MATESTKVLEENLYEEEVLQGSADAYQIGVQGVPFYVFNNKYAVSGAQSPEVFKQVLGKSLAGRKTATGAAEGEGFCDINGNCN